MNILDYMNNISTQIFAKGENIFKEGDPPDGTMYFIFQGLFAVTKKNPDGMVEVITELGPGDFFGELALLSRRPRSMTVTVISSKARTGILRQELLEKLARVNADFLYVLLRSTVQKLHRAEERLLSVNEEIQEAERVLRGK